jgi:DNA-binding XRE family transcriptional regulator/quercetin dioxygenase-like cupin family protein
LLEVNVTVEERRSDERRAPAVGAEVRRWRCERGLTLATVADRAGLNVGYLSQIENDKASPSLACLNAISDALDVPIAWFFLGDVPPPVVVRVNERPASATDLGRTEDVDGRTGRDVSMIEVTAGRVGELVGAHAHAGDEHHLILRGAFRLRQGEHAVDAQPGDYVRWDGTIPHEAEVTAIDPERGDAAMLIVRIKPRG